MALTNTNKNLIVLGLILSGCMYLAVAIFFSWIHYTESQEQNRRTTVTISRSVLADFKYSTGLIARTLQHYQTQKWSLRHLRWPQRSWHNLVQISRAATPTNTSKSAEETYLKSPKIRPVPAGLMTRPFFYFIQKNSAQRTFVSGAETFSHFSLSSEQLPFRTLSSSSKISKAVDDYTSQVTRHSQQKDLNLLVFHFELNAKALEDFSNKFPFHFSFIELDQTMTPITVLTNFNSAHIKTIENSARSLSPEFLQAPQLKMGGSGTLSTNNKPFFSAITIDGAKYQLLPQVLLQSSHKTINQILFYGAPLDQYTTIDEISVVFLVLAFFFISVNALAFSFLN